MAPAVRRSGRANRPNQKYTVDPLEEYKDQLMESDSEEETGPGDVNHTTDPRNDIGRTKHGEISDTSDDSEQTSDNEFGEDQAAEEEAAAAEHEQLDEDSNAGDSVGSEGPAGPMEINSNDGKVKAKKDISLVTVKRHQPRVQNRLTKSSRNKDDHANYNSLPIFDPLGASAAKGRNVHYTRGIPDLLHNQAREQRVLYSIGVGEEDLIAFIQSRDRWLNDVTAPYRKQSKETGGGGLAYSPYYQTKRRIYEANEGMRWYFEGGCSKAFSEFERYEPRSQDLGDNFQRSDSMISGSIDSPQGLGDMFPFEVLNMEDAFPNAVENNRAWILNVGGRIQALDWTPNQAGLSQYLAAAVTSKNPLDAKNSISSNVPSAYRAHTSQSPCLQIWKVRAKPSSANTGSKVDFATKPRLIQIMSTQWGNIKKMKWCPAADRPQDPDSRRIRLGLLAAVFEDGYVRVIDVHVDNNSKDSQSVIHLASAAFEAKSPDSIFTCITWLSGSSIAAGTADGNVAVWSIADALTDRMNQPELQSSLNMRPALYQQIHLTYIHSISSGYPSRPHILFTYSADGFTRATDLRSPQFDVVYSNRSRITQGPVVWHEISQCLMNADDNFALRAFSLRTFYRTISVARVSAFAVDIAASHLHASVLIGCTDGTIWVTNPARRLRDHKLKPSIQCVLKHEWRDAVKPASKLSLTAQTGPEGIDVDQDTQIADAVEDTMQDKNDVLSKPLIRLTTGYQLQEADMGQETRVNATKDMVAFATIYEEKTSVTQVAWNPNLRAGTWAAMGMGSGLVIVRDIAAD